MALTGRERADRICEMALNGEDMQWIVEDLTKYGGEKPLLPPGSVVLTKQEIDTVQEVLFDLISAMAEAGLTVHPAPGESGTFAWTATDEWIAKYLLAIRILQGDDGQRGPDPDVPG